MSRPQPRRRTFPRVDTAHHHPRIHLQPRSGWIWSCACGARTPWIGAPCSWRLALIQALAHANLLAP
jgi:hypothetical protein